jgi:FixJ family two-component response regulator
MLPLALCTAPSAIASSEAALNPDPENPMPEVVRQATAFLLDDDPTDRAALVSRIAAVGVIGQALGDLKSLMHFDANAAGCLVVVKRTSDEAALAVLDERRQLLIDAPVIVVGENVEVPFAIEAMKRGAFSVVELSVAAETLQATLLEAITCDVNRRQRSLARDTLRRALQTLTQGERDVVALIVDGVKNAVIAKRLGVSIRTVEVRRSSAYAKLAVTSAAGLVAAVWQALDGDLSKLAPKRSAAPERDASA